MFGNSRDNPRRSLVRMETERFIIEINKHGWKDIFFDVLF